MKEKPRKSLEKIEKKRFVSVLAVFFFAGLLLCSFQRSYAGSLQVEVSDLKVTVSAKDAEFGQVLSEVSRQANFKIDLPEQLLKLSISTKFTNLPLERALHRLFHLVKEKNYTVYYGSGGSITLIKAYRIEEKKQVETSKPVTPRKRRRVAPLPRRRRPAVQEPEMYEDEEFEAAEEEFVEPQYYDEDLYIPPSRPPYVPPRR
jgi:hypothetical protein